MSERITQCFSNLKQKGQAAFIAYIAAGDPDLKTTLALARKFEAIGVDILELGVPFSDPVADGTANQAAAQRALAAGSTIKGIFEMIRALRKDSQLPIVLFTYLNPVYTYGFDRFHKDAAEAGADGILILDLPPDEAARHAEFATDARLAPIRLIAPTTASERMGEVVADASGFIYYVSREGVTGEQAELSDGIAGQVAELRKWTSLPIAVGFGISTPEQAATVARQGRRRGGRKRDCPPHCGEQ